MEQKWHDNDLTAKGKQLHKRVHSDIIESRTHLRTERSVRVQSQKLGIHGQLDLLEIQHTPYSLTPVEYKKGQPKVLDCDRIQLCAQALCLEEMCGVQIKRAALWYWKPRKREWVEIDKNLRESTQQLIYKTKDMLDSETLPIAQWKRSCKSCSFFDECMPQHSDNSAHYIKELFKI